MGRRCEIRNQVFDRRVSETVLVAGAPIVREAPAARKNGIFAPYKHIRREEV